MLKLKSRKFSIICSFDSNYRKIYVFFYSFCYFSLLFFMDSSLSSLYNLIFVAGKLCINFPVNNVRLFDTLLHVFISLLYQNCIYMTIFMKIFIYLHHNDPWLAGTEFSTNKNALLVPALSFAVFILLKDRIFKFNLIIFI